MLAILSSIFTRLTLSFYEPLGVIAYTIPTKKRRHHYLFGGLGILLFYSLVFLLDYFRVPWPFQLVIKFLAATTIAIGIIDGSIWDGLYTAVWSNMTHMLLYNFLFAFNSLGVFRAIGADSFFLQISIVCIPGYIGAYFFSARKLCPDEKYGIDHKQTLIAVLTIFPFIIFNNYVIQSGGGFGVSIDAIYCCIFSCLCCIFVLSLQRSSFLNAQMHQEYHLMHQLWNQRQIQYEMSKENIDIINQKCHDLKHQINMLRELPNSKNRDEYINEVSDSIMIYDSTFHTGNEVLDTILTEKSLYCMKYGISIKCMAEGKCLEFMNPIDLYSLMGNAIDNAFESVMSLKDESLRMINIYVRTEMNFVTISIENYVENYPELVDGIPLTTKKDKHNHGFGIKSMQYTANKYHGQMTVNIENSMFVVRFLFPLENKESKTS